MLSAGSKLQSHNGELPVAKLTIFLKHLYNFILEKWKILKTHEHIIKEFVIKFTPSKGANPSSNSPPSKGTNPSTMAMFSSRLR